MNEQIFAAVIWCNKAVAFLVTEEFHGTCLLHNLLPKLKNNF
jgi:hypothetical protein